MSETLRAVDLTQGSVWKKLIRFLLPILASSFLQIAFFSVDAIIVGRFAGKEALAAIDAVIQVIWAPLGIFFGFATGITIVVSQLYGAKKIKELYEAIETGMTASVVVGLSCSLSFFLSSGFAVRVLNVPDNIASMSLIYLQICFAGMVFETVYNMSSGILRALGDSKTPFFALVVAGLMNTILDIIFVAYFKMGVMGAAVATVLSLFTACFFTTGVVWRAYRPRFRIHKDKLKHMTKVGLPIAVQASVFPVSNLIVRTYLNQVGSLGISAYALFGSMDAIFWSVTESMGSAVSTFVAQNFGSGFFERAKKGIRGGLIIMSAIIVPASVIIYFFTGVIGKLFLMPADYAVLPIAEQIAHIQAPYYLMFGIAELYSSAIKGTGETLRPMLVSVLFMAISRLVYLWLFIENTSNLYEIIFLYPMSWTLTGAAFLLYYLIVRNKLFQREIKPLEVRG